MGAVSQQIGRVTLIVTVSTILLTSCASLRSADNSIGSSITSLQENIHERIDNWLVGGDTNTIGTSTYAGKNGDDEAFFINVDKTLKSIENRMEAEYYQSKPLIDDLRLQISCLQEVRLEQLGKSTAADGIRKTKILYGSCVSSSSQIPLPTGPRKPTNSLGITDALETYEHIIDNDLQGLYEIQYGLQSLQGSQSNPSAKSDKSGSGQN